jgi:hypothetical protein
MPRIHQGLAFAVLAKVLIKAIQAVRQASVEILMAAL